MMQTIETFTSTQVCDELGITFRQLDYWERQGHISIKSKAEGSGSRRYFTRQEVEALRMVVDRIRLAESVLADFTSGELWRESMRLAR